MLGTVEPSEGQSPSVCFPKHKFHHVVLAGQNHGCKYQFTQQTLKVLTGSPSSPFSVAEP